MQGKQAPYPLAQKCPGLHQAVHWILFLASVRLTFLHHHWVFLCLRTSTSAHVCTHTITKHLEHGLAQLSGLHGNKQNNLSCVIRPISSGSKANSRLLRLVLFWVLIWSRGSLFLEILWLAWALLALRMCMLFTRRQGISLHLSPQKWWGDCEDSRW